MSSIFRFGSGALATPFPSRNNKAAFYELNDTRSHSGRMSSRVLIYRRHCYFLGYRLDTFLISQTPLHLIENTVFQQSMPFKGFSSRV